MSVFDRLASAYDRGMRPLEWLLFRRLRQQLFPSLQGNVLELGAGTGVNLPLYGDGARVVALDASSGMLQWAARRQGRRSVSLVRADAQRLPFPTGRFDVVSGSLVFCSIADPVRALAEARRALRPGGRLVLLEHTRGSGLGALLTDILHPLWRVCSRECHLNRETAQTVKEAGFETQRVEQHALGIVRVIEARP